MTKWPYETKIYLSAAHCKEEAMPFLADALGSWLWQLQETTDNKQKLLVHALKVRSKLGTIESLKLSFDALGLKANFYQSIKKYKDHHKKYLLVLLIIRPQGEVTKYPLVTKYQKLLFALHYTVPASVNAEVAFIHELSTCMSIGGGLRLNTQNKYHTKISHIGMTYMLDKITKDDFLNIRLITIDKHSDLEIVGYRRENLMLSFFGLIESRERIDVKEIQILLADGSVFASQAFDEIFTIPENRLLVSFTFSLIESAQTQIKFTEPPVYIFEYTIVIKDLLRESRQLYPLIKSYVQTINDSKTTP